MTNWRRSPDIHSNKRAPDLGQETCRKRIGQVLTAFVLLFWAFVGIFARYQLIGAYEKERFVEPAFFQRYRGVPVTLSRGNIVDRYGTPLHYPHWKSAIARLPSEGTLPAAPAKLIREARESDVAEALDGGIAQGLALVPEEIRYGPRSMARHVVGHVKANAYADPADNIGESGLEKQFQSILAGGHPASAGVVLTGEGEGLPGVGLRIAPPRGVPGDLRTTIDASVQRSVEDALDKGRVKRGAAVVLDAVTGEVLAMASRPQFNQNHAEMSLSDPDSPFVNRAVSAFAPGSVWKPVVMALALERKYVSEDSVFSCDGAIRIGERTVTCGSRVRGHGRVTVKEALAFSCNSALIQAALSIPGQELVEFAAKASFGRKTGIELPDEAGGELPHPANMFEGDVANFAIGQGYLSASPLQVAAFFGAIVRGGVWKAPRLILGSHEPPVRLFSEETARTLQTALLFGARQGTGKEAYVPVHGSAGKTGTAETGGDGSPSHAWFCGWAPVIAPKYIIAVFVEEGGNGPGVAAPIFRNIAERVLPR